MINNYYVFFSTSFLEYPDNKDIAVVCSISGCNHKCEGCHSPFTQSFIQKNAKKFEQIKDVVEDEYYYFSKDSIGLTQILDVISEFLLKNETNKLVLTGGDCLYHPELVEWLLLHLSDTVKLCIYSGFKIDKIKEIFEKFDNTIKKRNIFKNLIIKAGGFNKSLFQDPIKTEDKMILASSNQNFYNSSYIQLSEDGIYRFNNN